MGEAGGFEGITVTDPRHYIVYGGNAVNEVLLHFSFSTRPSPLPPG